MIGLMMVAYIIARMISFLTRTGDRSEGTGVKGFAVITMLLTGFCISGLLATGATTSLANAQTETATSHSNSGYVGISLVILIICYASRKKPIGGWLLCYYIALYLGTIFTVMMTIGPLDNYNPQNWYEKLRYGLFLASTIPSYVTKLAEIVAATVLLFKRYRSQSTVNMLKIVFVLSILFSVLSGGIHVAQWKDALLADFVRLVWSVVWLFYFSRSHRVEYVFKNKKWHSWGEHYYPTKMKDI